LPKANSPEGEASNDSRFPATKKLSMFVSGHRKLILDVSLHRLDKSANFTISAVLFVVPVKVFDGPVIRFFACLGEETAGDFSVPPVVRYALAAFAAP